MKLFDTHAHLGFDELLSNIDSVLRRSVQAGVTGCLTIGTNLEQSKKAVDLASTYEGIYATVGIHPHYAQDAKPEDLVKLKELTKGKKVVAIGETGLDFHYNFSKQEAQRNLFRNELHIAGQLGLPVIIHSRNAFEQTVEILDEFGHLKGVVFHCFTGSAEQAEILLDKGFFISFTGVVTFKNVNDIRRAARLVPLERMMLETDCPYMSPEPVRKQKINEPAMLIHIARFLAELKEMPLETLAGQTTATAARFFGLEF
ncbi:MAG: TatD family hydrolase [Planctomycetota bacterium]